MLQLSLSRKAMAMGCFSYQCQCIMYKIYLLVPSVVSAECGSADCCRYVCYTVTDASSIIQKLTGSRELKELFNEEELSKLRSHLTVEPTAVTTAPAENGTW